MGDTDDTKLLKKDIGLGEETSTEVLDDSDDDLIRRHLGVSESYLRDLLKTVFREDASEFLKMYEIKYEGVEYWEEQDLLNVNYKLENADLGQDVLNDILRPVVKRISSTIRHSLAISVHLD